MANLGKRQLARKNINISQSIRTYGTSLKAPLSEKKELVIASVTGQMEASSPSGESHSDWQVASQ